MATSPAAVKLEGSEVVNEVFDAEKTEEVSSTRLKKLPAKLVALAPKWSLIRSPVGEVVGAEAGE